MARFHGRKGRVYLAVTAGGQASPLPFIATWSFSAKTDKQDVTSMDDENKVYVAGLPDASGRFGGFMDDASAQTYEAAVDGEPRKFYLYPNRDVATSYFFGTIFPDYNADSGVADSGKFSADWNAASTIRRVSA